MDAIVSPMTQKARARAPSVTPPPGRDVRDSGLTDKSDKPRIDQNGEYNAGNHNGAINET